MKFNSQGEKSGTREGGCLQAALKPFIVVVAVACLLWVGSGVLSWVNAEQPAQSNFPSQVVKFDCTQPYLKLSENGLIESWSCHRNSWKTK